MGFGAGVGRVGPYYEQGNWYRGGAVQMLFIDWLYGEQNQVTADVSSRPRRRSSLIRRVQAPSIWRIIGRPWTGPRRSAHLPEMDIIKAVDGPQGIFADPMPVATGGAMIERTPNDPAWYKGGLWNDSMKINVPGFWFMSWYDVSIGPNLAAYNFVRKTAKPDIAKEQYAVIAPTGHCGYTIAPPNTRWWANAIWETPGSIVDKLTYGWFDHFLKGEDNHVLETMPRDPLLRDGREPMGDGEYLAAGRRAADDLLSFKRRQGEQHLSETAHWPRQLRPPIMVTVSPTIR